MTYSDGNLGPDIGHAQRFLRVEPVNVKNLHRFGSTQKGHILSHK
jgi:hypothetical protein